MKKSILAATIVFLFSSCASRQLHRPGSFPGGELKRGFTFNTRKGKVPDAGEKGFEFSSGTTFENTIIFGSQSFGIISLYPERTAVRWKFPIEGGVVSDLTIDKGTVYFTGGDGILYALSATSGKVQWSYDLKVPLTSRPSVSFGRLVVTTSDDQVFAFDSSTGKWLWNYRRRGASSTTVRTVAAPWIDSNEVVAGTSDGYLVGISLNEGQINWERRLHFGLKFTDVDASPILANGLIYTASFDGSVYALKRKDASIVWKSDIGSSRQLTLYLGDLYVSGSNGKVTKLNKETGKTAWEFELDGGVPTRPIFFNDRILVGSSDRYFYVLDGKTGALKDRFNAGEGSGFAADPFFGESPKTGLYALSMGGNLYQFFLNTP